MRFFRDPAVVKPERPAAKPIARDAVKPVFTYTPTFVYTPEPPVQSPFVRRALEGKLPAKEL